MKRVISLLIAAVMCCGMLTGCGGNKVEMSDFDSATNQNQVVNGFSFEVPKNWKAGENTDELQYYYPEDGVLMVVFEEAEEDIEDDNVRKAFVKSFGGEMEKFKLNSETEIEVDGHVAYQQEMSIHMDGKDFSTKMVIYNGNGGIVSMMLGVLKDSEKDYSKDFEKIIDSISKPLPFAKTTEDVNKLLNTLSAGGVCDFSVMNFGDDSSAPLTMWNDMELGVSIMAVGNEEGYITTIYTSAEDEENFVKASTMVLMGVDVLSPNASEFLTNLSPEALESMKEGVDGAKLEVIDGVSYMLDKEKDANGINKYTFTLQRDKETKEDYEEYLKTR